MRVLALTLLSLPLAACATSIAGMANDEIDLTLESTKAPDIVAGCLATSLQGDNPMIRLGEGHYVVARNNGYGFPVIRWDIIGTPTGSRLELRTSTPVGEGVDKARRCL